MTEDREICRNSPRSVIIVLKNVPCLKNWNALWYITTGTSNWHSFILSSVTPHNTDWYTTVMRRRSSSKYYTRQMLLKKKREMATVDPQGRPHSRPVVITISTQVVRPSARPKTSKSSDNHCQPGLWTGRVDHWWLLYCIIYFRFYYSSLLQLLTTLLLLT